MEVTPEPVATPPPKVPPHLADTEPSRSRVPSPQDHPAAYGALSVGSVAALLVTECKLRLGINLTLEEAGMIVTGVIAIFHFARGRVVRR